MKRDELRELREAATPGPWRVGSPSYKCPRHGEPGHVHDSAVCEYVLSDWYGHDVYAPELVPQKFKGRRNHSEHEAGLIAGQWDYEEGGVLHEADARLIALAPDLARLVEELGGALEKGQRFERAYQESLGATWTLPQKERLDSLQSAFLDSYLAALASLAELGERKDTPPEVIHKW